VLAQNRSWHGPAIFPHQAYYRE